MRSLLGLSQQQIDELSDEDFALALAECYWLQDQQTQIVRRGVYLGVADLFKRR